MKYTDNFRRVFFKRFLVLRGCSFAGDSSRSKYPTVSALYENKVKLKNNFWKPLAMVYKFFFLETTWVVFYLIFFFNIIYRELKLVVWKFYNYVISQMSLAGLIKMVCIITCRCFLKLMLVCRLWAFTVLSICLKNGFSCVLDLMLLSNFFPVQCNVPICFVKVFLLSFVLSWNWVFAQQQLLTLSATL